MVARVRRARKTRRSTWRSPAHCGTLCGLVGRGSYSRLHSSALEPRNPVLVSSEFDAVIANMQDADMVLDDFAFADDADFFAIKKKRAAGTTCGKVP